jgi:hypothetical protein
MRYVELEDWIVLTGTSSYSTGSRAGGREGLYPPAPTGLRPLKTLDAVAAPTKYPVLLVS